MFAVEEHCCGVKCHGGLHCEEKSALKNQCTILSASCSPEMQAVDGWLDGFFLGLKLGMPVMLYLFSKKKYRDYMAV